MQINNITEEFLDSLTGLPREAATTLCEENDYSVRILRIDSDNFMITCDFRVDRIGFQIDNGIITKCSVG